MANLYSQYASGLQFTAGLIVGSALGTSGLNPIVDRLNSISNANCAITGSMVSGTSTNVYGTFISGTNVYGTTISGTNFKATNISGTTIRVPGGEVNSTLNPIGAIIAWLKSYTNTPQTLPSGWVECNGQVLSDASSVYNGQTIPNLNGNNYFLRGNTSTGGTGGAATTSTQLTTGNWNGNVGNGDTNEPVGLGDAIGDAGGFSTELRHNTGSGGTYFTSKRSTTDSFSILPPYYNVVWIMRIK